MASLSLIPNKRLTAEVLTGDKRKIFAYIGVFIDEVAGRAWFSVLNDESTFDYYPSHTVEFDPESPQDQARAEATAKKIMKREALSLGWEFSEDRFFNGLNRTGESRAITVYKPKTRHRRRSPR